MVQLEDDRTGSPRSYLGSADAWRRNAGHVREHAARPHLDPQARAALLREADTCEKQANMSQAEAEDIGASAPAFPRHPQVPPPPSQSSPDPGSRAMRHLPIIEINCEAARQIWPRHAYRYTAPGWRTVITMTDIDRLRSVAAAEDAKRFWASAVTRLNEEYGRGAVLYRAGSILSEPTR